MGTTTVHYVQAVDTGSGTIREEDGPFLSREDADDRAEELRQKWTLATKVVVATQIERDRG